MLRTFLAIAAGALLIGTASAADLTLLNVSYDPTRELYAHLAKAFAEKFKADSARRSRSKRQTAARALRRVQSSTDCRPMWSPWRSPPISMQSQIAG
jgi:ABC-type sulfate transport system substrate-binding protein